MAFLASATRPATNHYALPNCQPTLPSCWSSLMFCLAANCPCHVTHLSAYQSLLDLDQQPQPRCPPLPCWGVSDVPCATCIPQVASVHHCLNLGSIVAFGGIDGSFGVFDCSLGFRSYLFLSKVRIIFVECLVLMSHF